MVDLSRPLPVPQPGPGKAAPVVHSHPSSAAVTVRAALERRRVSPTAASLSEAERRCADEHTLIELRRKVQTGELLSAATERLLWKMKFNGHLTIVVQNGRVLKSGYEEGYFRRRNDLGGFLLDV